jgi:hypothetical protein
MSLPSEPFGQKLTAGVEWSWTVCLADYRPAAGWSLKYFLRGNGAKLDIVATASGDEFAITVSATDTGKLQAGSYAWQQKVVNGADQFEIARGVVEIVADLESATGDYEGRSHVKKMLDAVRAVLESRASRVESEYQVQGRSLRLLSLSELYAAEAYYVSRYNAELVASGQLPARYNQINASFGSAK